MLGTDPFLATTLHYTILLVFISFLQSKIQKAHCISSKNNINETLVSRLLGRISRKLLKINLFGAEEEVTHMEKVWQEFNNSSTSNIIAHPRFLSGKNPLDAHESNKQRNENISDIHSPSAVQNHNLTPLTKQASLGQ